MKNRIIALLMVLTLLLACFASCGPKEPADDENKETDVTPKPDDGKTDINDGDVTNPKYPWKTTNLVFSISENSDNQQLPSSSRRYLAGDLKDVVGGGDKVDVFVSDRNSDALKETNVTVEYRYLPDTDVYGWSQNIAYINGQVTSGDAETPDVFVNFVYDMVACSLLGNFANLRSTTMYKDGHELAGYNNFAFTQDENLNEFGEYEDTGKGYMYEYMRSLTLSKFKMYCLSSDYFIDMVRAFFAIPVNVELLETFITATSEDGKWNSDRTETYDDNGDVETNYTIEDLYELVYAGEWNYDALAQFSNAVTGDGYDGTINSDRFGFALGTDTGLPASGMLYTTPIVIVEREYNTSKGEYEYSYPNMKQVTDANGKVTHVVDENSEDATFEDLIDFCDKLSALMNTRGVVTTSQTKDGVHSATSIRSAFVNNRLLFGGIIVLGGLEHEDYAKLNGEGKSGYGIVPVPLYNDSLGYHEDTDTYDYLTQVHNNGKIGAIAFSTKNFAQCTAYLDYQSVNSNQILEEYYGYTLSNIVDEGGIDNTQMLTMIRENVRSSFDKAYEDALGEFYKGQTGGTSDEQKWHNIIKTADFKLSDMRGQYATVAGAKADRLYNLETKVFPTLPN